MGAKQAKETVQSVERCLDVLQAVASASQSIGVSALSRQLGLSKATSHRMCQTLLERQFLQQDPRTGRYCPGLRLLEVAGRLVGHIGVAQVSRTLLMGMVREMQETAFAGTLIQLRELQVHDEVGVDHAVQPRSLMGLRLALPQAPGGLLCLARLDGNRLREVAADIAGRVELQGTLSAQEIIERARALRGQPYSVQPGLPYQDVTVIASPIMDRRQQVLGVVGYCLPRLRAEGADLAKLGEQCVSAAREMASLMGD